MNSMKHRFAAPLAIAALLLALAPAQAAGARLEGYLVNVDGRGASGYRVHLIDAEGKGVARTPTSEEGVYRFRDLPTGSYSLGIENPEGGVAPVAAPPLRLDEGQLARRDVKLLQAGPGEGEAVGRENFSFGIWWAGLTPGAKAWSVIGTFVVVGLTVAALDDDESNGSEYVP